jgi:hypothetical protein
MTAPAPGSVSSKKARGLSRVMGFAQRILGKPSGRSSVARATARISVSAVVKKRIERSATSSQLSR